METVKQCREDGYRGKLKKENEDDDVERDIEDWINGDRRAEEEGQYTQRRPQTD